MLRHFARALPLASVRPAVARPWQWGSRGAFSTSQEEGFQLHYPRNAAEGAAATEATEEQTDEFPDEFTDDRLNKARREDAMQESTEDEVFAEDLARVSRRPPDPFAVSDISEEDMLVVEAKLICDEPRADSSMLGFQLLPENMGKYYVLTQEDLDKYIPEGVSGKLKKYMEMVSFPENMQLPFMLREPAVSLMRAMQEFNDSHKWSIAPTVLLRGERGVGKSAAMLQLVHFARSAGWLTMFVPNSGSLLTATTRLYESPFHPGKLETPKLAQQILMHVRAAHADVLGKLPMRHTYDDQLYTVGRDAEGKAVGTRSKFGHLAKGDAKEARGTLLDMVDFGLLAPEVASQAVMDFRRELCSQQDLPVLVALDEVNKLYEPCNYLFKRRKVHTEDLVMFDAIRPFEQDCVREGHEPRNGMLLCAESHTTGDITPFSADVRIRAFDRVVQPYSKEELRSLLAFHVHAKPAFSQVVDDRTVGGYFMLTNGVGSEVQTELMFYRNRQGLQEVVEARAQELRAAGVEFTPITSLREQARQSSMQANAELRSKLVAEGKRVPRNVEADYRAVTAAAAESVATTGRPEVPSAEPLLGSQQ